MTRLKELAIEAHGGLQRWRQFEQVTADLVQGGVLWPLKGHPQTLERTTVTVGPKEEWRRTPRGAGSRRSRFAPGRVVLEAGDGSVNRARASPGIRCKPMDRTAACLLRRLRHVDLSNHAVPARLARRRDGRVGARQTDSGDWRRLAVRFPTEIATHSAVQTLYFDGDGLLRRHDYDVEMLQHRAACRLDRYLQHPAQLDIASTAWRGDRLHCGWLWGPRRALG
jgi:hypothetical protein